MSAGRRKLHRPTRAQRENEFRKGRARPPDAGRAYIQERLQLFAAVELEGEDTGIPIAAGFASILLVVIHLAVPEGAVVAGINSHAALTPPPWLFAVSTGFSLTTI